jgi:hypothetical protein
LWQDEVDCDLGQEKRTRLLDINKVKRVRKKEKGGNSEFLNAFCEFICQFRCRYIILARNFVRIV